MDNEQAIIGLVGYHCKKLIRSVKTLSLALERTGKVSIGAITIEDIRIMTSRFDVLAWVVSVCDQEVQR
ncbi:predicted protein [Botrytis cinerea T4]|uniref:Uncharacterized protein n=1 Tax=Botryotinia fuckeliana (strain T4) TaxID=999810 RepID=G2YQE2_BOTF4|nr:predicted protein [Botrytis cinerea T4]